MSIDRFEAVVVIAGVALASGGCDREPSTASRSAAAYDEAREKGEPIGGAAGHGHETASAGEPGGVTDGRDEMDHAAMGHGPAARSQSPPVSRAARHSGHSSASAPAGGRAEHEGHAAVSRPAEATPHAGHARPRGTGADHAEAEHATGHAAPAAASQPATTGHAAHGAAAPTARPGSGPQPSPAMNHAAMGHGSAPAPAASPEAASTVAAPGQPAATLDDDALDAPAATSVRDAARAREAASSGHAMTHGAYRQVDAGRDDVPATSPATPADPHAGHVMPAPRPSPSPGENR